MLCQMGVGGHHHATADYSQQKALVPIVDEAKWAPRPIWMVMEKRQSLALIGFRTPALPARRDAPYLLRYSGAPFLNTNRQFSHDRHTPTTYVSAAVCSNV